MSEQGIPRRVIDFIAENVYSIGQLETLFLLRSTPEKTWSAESVSRELRSTQDTASRHLADLRTRGLIANIGPRQSTFGYKPNSKEIEDAVTALWHLYQTHRARIIDIIYSDKIRTIQVFADAFKVKKHD